MFLSLQVDLDRDIVITALDEIAARRRRPPPPRTRDQLLERLTPMLPTTVAFIRQRHLVEE